MSYPIGISFGLEHITISKAGEDDTVEFIGRHATSPAYQDFFQRVLRERVQGNLDTRPGREVPYTHLIPPKLHEVEYLLGRELEKVIVTAKSSLGCSELVLAISVPDHWNATMQRAVFKATEGAKMPLAGIHMLLRLPRALEKVYHLDSDVFVTDYYFVAVDYNRTYLHLLLCETARDGGYGIVENQVQLSHLGETSVFQRGYHEEVLESINRFLSLTTVKGQSTDGLILYSRIKAVTLSGEASSEGMQGMRKTLLQIFGQEMLCESHPPLYAAALGAARAAKLQVDYPKSTKHFVSMPEYIPDESKAP
ncbi:MAG: hypothetical protein LQ351_007348 [Letrouitia transgressa]|nr:MAG: hypothetical protein LQ351_007348 [Letrouitia transgressa]